MYFSAMSMGQYVPLDSFVHRLDPRAKLFSLLFFVTGVLSAGDGLSIFVCCTALIGLTALARLSWGLIYRSSRPVLFLVLFTFVFNLFTLWGQEGDISFALAEGGFLAFRLLILMLFALLLPLTTAPLELADGLERLLLPLKRFGFPAHECSMMTGMALRFIPLLMEEADRIMKAQISRGARLDQGGLIRRVIAFFPVLIPLFVIVFRRADEMALAMEARGYEGGAGRTRRCPLCWKKSDTGATILSGTFVLVFVVVRRFWA